MLRTAIDFLIDASDVKVRGNIELANALIVIKKCSNEEGLSPDNITVLLDLVARRKFADSVSSQLIKCLIPKTCVSEDAVLSAFALINMKRPSQKIQKLILQWILLVYDLIEKKDRLHSIYQLIFNLLENDNLCAEVCHLLYLLTKKDNVRLFRIRRLVSLQRRVGKHPHITGLLNLYKVFAPNAVSVTGKQQKRFFKHPNSTWAARIRTAQSHVHVVHRPMHHILQQSRSVAARHRARNANVELLPPLMASMDSASCKSATRDKITTSVSTEPDVPLIQLGCFKDFVGMVDKVEMPSQISSILSHQHLLHVLRVSTDKVATARLSYWLHHTLYEELINNNGKNEQLSDFLQKLIIFSDFIQEGVPVVDCILEEYLPLWSGEDYRKHILQLVSRLRFMAFEELHDAVLIPLRCIYLSSPVHIKSEVLHCLTNLLHNYAAYEWPRYENVKRTRESEGVLGGNVLHLTSVFTTFHDFDGNFIDVVTQLIRFIDKLCILGLMQESYHALLVHCALQFAELIPDLHLTYGIPLLDVISPGIVYSALLAYDAVSVSRLCKIICRYAKMYKSLKSVGIKNSTAVTQDVEKLNTYILDISDALWRNVQSRNCERSFLYNVNDTALEEHGIDIVHSEAFNLACHPAFASLSNAFLVKSVVEGTKIHPSMIRSHVRYKFLSFISQYHLNGIDEFVEQFIH